MDGGGKQSATPLSHKAKRSLKSLHISRRAVAAALCRRSPGHFRVLRVSAFVTVLFLRDEPTALWQYFRMAKLTASEIKSALAKAPDWKRTGLVISRTFEFKDFVAAMKFVNAVARLAENAWHHPDIDIRWNKVTLALTTHSEGGLTKTDFHLAKQFDALA